MFEKHTDINNIEILGESNHNKLIMQFRDEKSIINANSLFNNTLNLEKYSNKL